MLQKSITRSSDASIVIPKVIVKRHVRKHESLSTSTIVLDEHAEVSLDTPTINAIICRELERIVFAFVLKKLSRMVLRLG